MIRVTQKQYDDELLAEMIHNSKSHPSPTSSLLQIFKEHLDSIPLQIDVTHHSSWNGTQVSFSVQNQTLSLHRESQEVTESQLDVPVDYSYTGSMTIREPSVSSQHQVKLTAVNTGLYSSKVVWIGERQEVHSKVYYQPSDVMCFNNLRAQILQGETIERDKPLSFPVIMNMDLTLFPSNHLLASLFTEDFLFYQDYEEALKIVVKNKDKKIPEIILSIPVNANLTCVLDKPLSNINLLSVGDVSSSYTILPFNLSLHVQFDFSSLKENHRRLEEESIESVLEMVIR